MRSISTPDGYVNGRRTSLQLAPIEGGKLMREDAAEAFNRMATAAREAGHSLTVARAFATMLEQRVLYAKYLGAQLKNPKSTAAARSSAARSFSELLSSAHALEHAPLQAAYKAGGGNLAARPGYSNHQGGIAVDVGVGGTASAVYRWLAANAGRFGFVRTVKSEPWHWEYRPGAKAPAWQ